ncbi:MAG: TerC family protein, partial [Nocardioidaceae bacterium]|nr:TerC family protein [Nocardioidaceae bacterium]
LAFVLAFIGVKLVLQALHENELPFVNGGSPVPVPQVSSLASLAVIAVALVVTAVASLMRSARDDETSRPDASST